MKHYIFEFEGYGLPVDGTLTSEKPTLYWLSKLYSSVGKRGLDILLVLLSAPLLIPVVFLLWVLVRSDGGPGFYSQIRIGKDGRQFRCWKLRTMIVDADRKLQEMCARDPELAREWHTNQKLANDPRITRFGAFLRKSSLDELPQLWNILMGEMSVVGPRPFIKNQSGIYNAAGGRAYYTVRPGLTGPWQVFGRGDTSFIDRVRFDTDYCRRLSFLTDVIYIMRTFSVVLRRTGC